MSTVTATQELEGRGRLRDRLGDRLLYLLTFLASLAAVGLIVLIAWEIVRSAHLALSKFGVSFLWGTTWDVNKATFGAAPALYGTAVTCTIAMIIAAPLGIAIALFLSELAPQGVRVIVGSLVETLAAVPSVVLGLWGILVLGPLVADHGVHWMDRWLGFIPFFNAATGENGASSLFVAGLILAIMVVPIVASICRELFLSVPPELEEAALALGATRWEMVRGVILSSSKPGIAAALILGLGRALGEAIAVAQVIGAGYFIHWSLFGVGDTLASRIVSQYQGATTNLQVASLFYLAAILLVIGLVTNLIAQVIVRRFHVQGAR
ncbi:MAG TPA: phosphate ABC transporter permease subunit PstC [Gaiellaceae bacterium]|nr:phosphate ABC transporter permease subunit PstC [Gaiellaceae bacterium]